MTKLVVAVVGKPFGVAGWNHVTLRVHPATVQTLPSNQWFLKKDAVWQEAQIERLQWHRTMLCCKIKSVSVREVAKLFVGTELGIDSGYLPKLPEGEFYWNDFIGCSVVEQKGKLLGKVVNLLETGANDVLIVRDAKGDEILIPVLFDKVIQSVQLEGKTILVDWSF